MCQMCDLRPTDARTQAKVLELRGAEREEAAALAAASAVTKHGSAVLSQWTHPLTGQRSKTDPQVKCTWNRDPRDEPKVLKAHLRTVRLRTILAIQMGVHI